MSSGVQVGPRVEKGFCTESVRCTWNAGILTETAEDEGDVVAAKQRLGLVTGDEEQTDGATDGEKTENTESSAVVFRAGPVHSRKDGESQLDLVGDPDGQDKEDDLNCASGHLH